MIPEQLEALRESRAELAALRVTLRREHADLSVLSLEHAATPPAMVAGVAADPAAAALVYAVWNLKQADRALTTTLEALRPLLDGEAGA